jgi:hypothetical protein
VTLNQEPLESYAEQIAEDVGREKGVGMESEVEALAEEAALEVLEEGGSEEQAREYASAVAEGELVKEEVAAAAAERELVKRQGARRGNSFSVAAAAAEV